MGAWATRAWGTALVARRASCDSRRRRAASDSRQNERPGHAPGGWGRDVRSGGRRRVRDLSGAIDAAPLGLRAPMEAIAQAIDWFMRVSAVLRGDCRQFAVGCRSANRRRPGWPGGAPLVVRCDWGGVVAQSSRVAETRDEVVRVGARVVPWMLDARRGRPLCSLYSCRDSQDIAVYCEGCRLQLQVVASVVRGGR